MSWATRSSGRLFSQNIQSEKALVQTAQIREGIKRCATPSSKQKDADNRTSAKSGGQSGEQSWTNSFKLKRATRRAFLTARISSRKSQVSRCRVVGAGGGTDLGGS